jgi:hypothetical protein
MEYWSTGALGNRSDGFEFLISNLGLIRTQCSTTPSLHYSFCAPTYAASASRQPRIGGKASSSETRQRKGV